jgi:hypothetical protein
MKVETEGEARLALHAFLKHAAKNFKKAVEVDDDRVVAATLVDFLTKIHPYYEVSLLLAGYELPKDEGEDKKDDK